MLVNQIQRDMSRCAAHCRVFQLHAQLYLYARFSSNQLEVCTALSAVCKIVTVDMIPAVLGEVGPVAAPLR